MQIKRTDSLEWN